MSSRSSFVHVIAWRDKLLSEKKMDATVRGSLFDYLCNANAVTHNPVTDVERPNEGANKGKTPAS